ARLSAAEKKIAGATSIITDTRARFGDGASAAAEARLKAASLLYTEGKAKIAAQAYGDAFAVLQQASRAADEARLLAAAKNDFNLDLRLGVHAKTAAPAPRKNSTTAPEALGTTTAPFAPAENTARDTDKVRIEKQATETEDLIGQTQKLMERGRTRFGAALTLDAEKKLEHARERIRQGRTLLETKSFTQAEGDMRDARRAAADAEMLLEANGIFTIDLEPAVLNGDPRQTSIEL
ncbi:MAG: hypothetical protein U1A28_03590, partial [Patescibacteria group bacterium]|nr:hypothetical protein [Patescibacteria group bacterium]